MNYIVEEQQQQKMRYVKTFSNKLKFGHTSCRQLQMVNSYHSIETEFSNNWHKITIIWAFQVISCTSRDATLRWYTLGPKSARYLMIRETLNSVIDFLVNVFQFSKVYLIWKAHNQLHWKNYNISKRYGNEIHGRVLI